MTALSFGRPRRRSTFLLLCGLLTLAIVRNSAAAESAEPPVKTHGYRELVTWDKPVLYLDLRWPAEPARRAAWKRVRGVWRAHSRLSAL